MGNGVLEGKLMVDADCLQSPKELGKISQYCRTKVNCDDKEDIKRRFVERAMVTYERLFAEGIDASKFQETKLADILKGMESMARIVAEFSGLKSQNVNINVGFVHQISGLAQKTIPANADPQVLDAVLGDKTT